MDPVPSDTDLKAHLDLRTNRFALMHRRSAMDDITRRGFLALAIAAGGAALAALAGFRLEGVAP
jgi:hypothetical protein